MCVLALLANFSIQINLYDSDVLSHQFSFGFLNMSNNYDQEEIFIWSVCPYATVSLLCINLGITSWKLIWSAMSIANGSQSKWAIVGSITWCSGQFIGWMCQCTCLAVNHFKFVDPEVALFPPLPIPTEWSPLSVWQACTMAIWKMIDELVLYNLSVWSTTSYCMIKLIKALSSY